MKARVEDWWRQGVDAVRSLAAKNLFGKGTNESGYKLPTSTLPSLGLEHHIADLQALKALLKGLGIDTSNTRIDRYLKYLEEIELAGTPVESRIFKHSLPGPFKHAGDWYLYVLREVHELIWILKGLQKQVPKGAEDKLHSLIGGRDFAALDSDSRSRNAQFELRIASYFCQTGWAVDMSTETDLIVDMVDFDLLVECKRIGSTRQLAKRLDEAREQLVPRLPESGKKSFGAIVSDVTRVAFNHNGLTWAITPEHSRDLIQNKIRVIGERVAQRDLLRGSPIVLCWLQIHISSLIQHPPMPATRFSSYLILKDDGSKGERRAARQVHDVFRTASALGDARESPTRPLTIRKGLKIPGGTRFSIKNELLLELLDRNVTPRAPEDVIASIELEGHKHEFTYFEFEPLMSEYLAGDPSSFPKEITELQLLIVLQMYIRRYPYEEN